VEAALTSGITASIPTSPNFPFSAFVGGGQRRRDCPQVKTLERIPGRRAMDEQFEIVDAVPYSSADD
jgi:hypothetical protein